MGWIGLIWLRIGTSEGSCEHGNVPSGSIKCWEYLEELHNWQLLKKSSAPCVSGCYERIYLRPYTDSVRKVSGY
jgi:hypothetical protein